MITLKQAIEYITEDIRNSSKSNLGGPFGAFVYKTILKDEKDEYIEVVATGTNGVVTSNDPTAHAEIVAIRSACRKLATYDLSGYSIYASGYPCPMCLGAIIWAGIKEVVYSQSLEDAESIGFRDKEMYVDTFKDPNSSRNVSLIHLPNSEMSKIYEDYKKAGVIY